MVEALGYLGGVLAAIAGFIAVTELWPDIPTGAQLAFAAAGALVLLAGGAVRAGGDPALCRLRSVLWALSTGSLAAFAGLLGAQVWDLGPISTTLLTAVVTAPYAAVLWTGARTPIQHLVMFASLAVFVGSAVAWLDPDLTPWSAGLGMWVFSAGLIVGSQLTMDLAAGHVLALVTVAGLLVAGVALRRVWLLGIGAFGVLQAVPLTADRYLPDAVGAPLAMFAVGVVLLAVAVWLARSNRLPKPH